MGKTLMDYGPINDLARIFDCMNMAHLPTTLNINDTMDTKADDDSFLETLVETSDLPWLMLDADEDTSAETNIHGRSCVTSFSPEAILNAEFASRHRRPHKILLDLNKNSDFILNYIMENRIQDDMDFESPPLIVMTRISANTWASKVFCADTKGYSEHVWTRVDLSDNWIKTPEQTDRLRCVPNLKVNM